MGNAYFAQENRKLWENDGPIVTGSTGGYRLCLHFQGAAVRMKDRSTVLALVLSIAYMLSGSLTAWAQQVARGTAAGTTAELPPGRDTDRPSPEAEARLQKGPALPYKVDEKWPSLPQGYNF